MSGPVCCVFSGWLYGQESLLTQLGLPPAGPESEECTPAWLVAAAFDRWGEDLLSRLDGVFALAIWDDTRRVLLCASDVMGFHPLYYAEVGTKLVFSWDIGTVREHPDVPSDFNRVVLAEHLTRRWLNAEETAFAKIRRLPAAHGLEYQAGRLRVFRYWNPLPENQPIDWVTRDELEEFPKLLREAVARSMRGERAGILLSGGFDSVSVAWQARETARHDGLAAPRAYSIAFPGAYSEEPVQRAVARRLGLSQQFVHFGKDFSEGAVLSKVLAQSSGLPRPPVGIYQGFFLDLLRIAQSDGCGVVLTGEGGDEWLTVDPSYSADLIRRGDLLELMQLLRTTLHSWDFSPLSCVRSVLWRNGLRAVGRDWVWRRWPRAAEARRRRLSRSAIPDWLGPDPDLRRELEDRFQNLWRRETYGDGFYRGVLRDMGANAAGHNFYEESFYRDARAGVPTTHPYWDRRVVEFLFRTPPSLLNGGGRSKALVRNAVAETFPEVGFDLQKKVLMMDLPSMLFGSEAPRLWNELRAPRCMADLGLLDPVRFERLPAAWASSGNRDALYMLWQSVSVESWIRSHTQTPPNGPKVG